MILRRMLAPVLLWAWMLCSCSHEGSTPFDQRLSASGDVQGGFEVTEEAIYSVALAANVQGLTAQDRTNREWAWEHLSGTSSTEPLVARITLAPRSEPDRMIINESVVNPSFSSWSDDVLYMELARARLTKGKYVIRATFTGRSLQQPSFLPTVVVQRTFAGK